MKNEITSSPPNTPTPLDSLSKNSNKTVITLGTVLLLILTSSLTYWYFQSQNSKKVSHNEEQLALPTPSSLRPQPSLIPTQIADISSKQDYVIIEGSLYKSVENGEKELIANKNELRHEQLEITEIHSFILSPDKTKILLFTMGGISPYVLYYKNITTKEIVFIDFGEEAVWSPNSRYIALTRRPSDVGPLRLYVFDSLINKEIETIQSKDRVHTGYNHLVWSSTNDAITAEYETRDDVPYGNIIDKGEVQIRLK